LLGCIGNVLTGNPRDWEGDLERSRDIVTGPWSYGPSPLILQTSFNHNIQRIGKTDRERDGRSGSKVMTEDRFLKRLRKKARKGLRG
jgi:hypothetical protein